MSVLHFNRDNFQEEVLDTENTVLVDFWAPWCGPCRMLAPIIDEIAGEHAGHLKVGKINIDESPELADQFGVMSIPTVMVFEKGQLKAQSVGVQPKHQLEALIG